MLDRWALAYHQGGPEQGPPASMTWIDPPAGRFYADPFLVTYRGQPWVFFEDYDGATQRGHISASPLLDFKAQPVLVTPWHLSYPHLIDWQGELWCIPEQHQAGNVTLYRCLEFPNRWKPETVLLDGFAGVDPTVIWWGDNWWMWVGEQSRRARDNTFLFQAPQLTGPWREHRRSPAIHRPDLARPAGQPWQQGNRWFRPAQNRTRTYGGSLVVYSVDHWDQQEYQESEWARWEPSQNWPYPHGLHHVCSRDGWTVWDGKRYVEEL